jgi:hypothetical protein
MTRFAQVVDSASIEIPASGEWVAHHEVDGETVEVTLLRQGMEDWDEDRFAEFGVYPITPAADPSEGQQFATKSLALPVDGVVVETATYEDIVPPYPLTLTRMQYYLAVQQLGGLDAVVGAIESLESDDPIRIYFEQAAVFDRTDERFVAFSTSVGATEEDYRAVFTLGATIPA